MQLNPEISEILKSHQIDKDQGYLFLLGVYFNLDVEKMCSEETIKAINLTKIVEKDYGNKTLKWNIPLFLGQETNFEWVISWNANWLANPSRKASNPDCIKRMKEFFSKYPHIRKEDVINATDFYFRSTTPEYLKNSAAFIFDGAGANKKSILLGWCERVMATGSITGNSNLKGKIIK